MAEALLQVQKSAQKSKCENCGKRKKDTDGMGERKWCRVCISAYQRGQSGTVALIHNTIPKLYRGAELEHLPDALQGIIKGLPDERGLMLWGEPGRGKTYSMMAAAKHYLIEGWDIELISYELLCSRIRSSYQNEAKETEYDIIKSLRGPDKLFIDDVGTTVSGEGQESDFSLRIFLTILDQRMNYCKPTYITTNKSVEQLRKSFDARIASRIEQACEVIQVSGKDRRKQTATSR